MCGIAGIIRVSPSREKYAPIPAEWIDILDAHIAWRGIDGAGRFFDSTTLPDGRIVDVVLIHRRLSIIDHRGGHQPMVAAKTDSQRFSLIHPTTTLPDHIVEHPDGIAITDLRQAHEADNRELLAIIYNGCLYNNQTLRATLEAAGNSFETHSSDTETFLRCFLHSRQLRAQPRNQADAQPLLQDAEGMYALALWDRSLGAVSMWRDPFGEKPLFRMLSNGTLAFASTNAALLQLRAEQQPDPRRRTKLLDRNAMEHWLRFGFNATETPCPDIEISPPGVDFVHHNIISASGRRSLKPILFFIFLALIPISWMISAIFAIMVLTGLAGIVSGIFAWRHKFRRPPLLQPSDLSEHLARAVAQRLEADEPIACLLSGGIDSSLIAYHTRRHAGTVTTISVRMPDARYDESHHAERVAEIIGSVHHTVEIEPDPAGDLIRLIECMGLPFGDSSILPTYWACRAASLHAKVLLTGDGADELFYGYNRYQAADAMRFPASLIARLFPSRWLGPASDPTSAATRRRRFIEAIRHAGYIDLVSIFPTPLLNQLLPKRNRSFRLTDESMPEKDAKRPKSAAQARSWDLYNYLPADILMKIDTASLAAGIEARCPFLDTELAQAAIKTPQRIHMRHGQRKHLLRSLAREFLPDDLVDRPKQGFAIPIGEWFRSDYGSMRTLLMDLVGTPAAQKHARPFGRIHDTLTISNQFVTRIIDEHFAAGDLPSPSGATRVKPRDHSQRLFLLCSLAIWARSLDDGVHSS